MILRLIAITIFFVLGIHAAGVNDFEPTATAVSNDRSVRVGPGFFLGGTPTFIRIVLNSQGDEHVVSFSVGWRHEYMTYVGVDLDQGAPADTTLTLNTSQIMAGRIGITLRSQSGFQAGPRTVVRITGYCRNLIFPFPISLTDLPTAKEILDNDGTRLEAAFAGADYIAAVADPYMSLSTESVHLGRGGAATTTVGFRRAFGSFGGISNASFSLRWDPLVLDYAGATLGSLLPPGTTMTIDESRIREGRLGASFNGVSPFLDPVFYKLLDLSLTARPDVPPGLYAVSFDNKPTPFRASTPSGSGVTTFSSWVPGFINVGNFSYINISGRVLSPNFTALRDATVVLTDSYGISQAATTSSFGIFGFTGLLSGSDYTLTVRSKRYRFAPMPINLSGNLNSLQLLGLE